MSGIYHIDYGIIHDVKYDDYKNIIAPSREKAEAIAYAIAVAHYDDVLAHEGYCANTVDYYYDTSIDHLVALKVDLTKLSNSQLNELMQSAVDKYCAQREESIFYKVKEI